MIFTRCDGILFLTKRCNTVFFTKHVREKNHEKKDSKNGSIKKEAGQKEI